ncbi:MAG: hypothetical protein ACSLFP_17545, partial [Acidimicrobiales bacterium]
PLGAGPGLCGRVVRRSGRAYEALRARVERRAPQPLFHAALVATTSAGRTTIEMTPVPRSAGPRGVVAGGSVGMRWLGRLRIFRYEIRRWPGGVIPDLPFAAGEPVRITSVADEVASVLDLVPHVPVPVWGRDELRLGEMWNSNSVVAWLLASADLVAGAGQPPDGGRAPGWSAGLEAARSEAEAAGRYSSGH